MEYVNYTSLLIHKSMLQDGLTVNMLSESERICET